MIFRVNTTSEGKLEEFRRFLPGPVEAFTKNIEEPLADSLTVVRYKASQLENVLVDDTALDIEGEEVGSLIKWKMDDLHKYAHRLAHFRCFLGLQKDGKISIYKGEVLGHIAPQPRGEGFGFNPWFVPEGATLTYAEEKPDLLNARFLAVQAFLNNKPFQVLEPLPQWVGEFQQGPI